MQKGKKIGVNSLSGDKVVWIIALLLILLSIVCSFSSTSKLLAPGETRLDIVGKHMLTVLGGLVVIIICYNIRNAKFFRTLGKYGFVISLFLALLVASRIDLGFVKSLNIHGSYRALKVFGIQVFVYEVVKVLMVLYMARTVEMLNAEKETTWKKRILYIYIPFFSISGLVLAGSNSAAILIGAVMFLTILLGDKDRFKDCLVLLALTAVLFFGSWASYELTDHKFPERFGLLFSRKDRPSIEEMEERYIKCEDNILKGKILDSLRQPCGAMIAVKQGGIIGKGPGQSTQRYIVPVYSEDYIFSFIVEEYGILGAIMVILLYASLLARASIITRNCGDACFEKTTVAGLSLLITMQAFLHICVNVDIGPMTGQTLPLVSHGRSAFLSFCAAFGIIISISRIAQERIRLEQEKEGALTENENEKQQ